MAALVNRTRTDGYNLIMGEIRTNDFDDPHGTSMSWLFALAEVAYVEASEILPDFSPSPLLEPGNRDSIDSDDYPAAMVLDLLDSGQVHIADVRSVYEVISRYNDWVRVAGRNY